jgi:sugar phosphate isomerase/epimerase
MHDRRTFLATLGTAALGAALGCRTSSQVVRAPRRLDRVGLQLYTLRNETRRDMAGTVAQVAAIGYREVEFAGYNGLAPAAVRDLLAKNSLTSPSTHIGLQTGDAWKKSLDDTKAIGHDYITVPSLSGARATLDDWKRIAEQFNVAAAAAKAAGLRFAYHNHDFEFRPIAGAIPYDLLIAQTDPALVHFQVDVYWMTKAGGDILDYLTRFPTRITMLHLKDSSGPPAHQMTDVGSGTIKWPAILARAAQLGITHSFVEHDQPADAFASVRASYAYLSTLEF